MPDPADLPTHSDSATGVKGDSDEVLVREQVAEFTRKPIADLTIDAEPENIARSDAILYDPRIHQTAPEESEITAATWEDLRRLPAPPSAALSGGAGVVTFICVQHPNLIIADPNGGEAALARFTDGYLTTDDPKLIKILSDPKQRYVQRLDMSRVAG